MISRFHLNLVFLVLVFICLAVTESISETPVVRIGIVGDGPEEGGEEILELFKGEITGLMRSEFDIQFPPDKNITADWTAGGVRSALDKLMKDPDVDIVLALGVIASNEAYLYKNLPKPVIAPFIIDAELQGFSIKNGASGIKNLNYVSFPAIIHTEIEEFLNIVPFTKLAMFVPGPYFAAIPDLSVHVQKDLDRLGIENQMIRVGISIDEAFANMSPGTEAVYIGVQPQLSSEEFDKLVAGLIERKIPSFSFMGRSDVERGIMAATKTDFFPKIARRVALNLQRILLGEEPGSIPVAFVLGKQLILNMATARAVGVSPSWSVLTEAELIHMERKEVERRLDLKSAVLEAVEVNMDIAAKKLFVSAGKQDVKKAMAGLLPQIDLSGTGLVIDEDRAEASFGQQAERTVSGSITATQVIFSEPVWANLSIQKKIQKTRERELEQLRLDIVQEAATAYLNVLKSKTYERIQKENLKRTSRNLELARVREVVGSAGPAEVYRWESEIASNRKIVIEANSMRNLAEIELNRLLHRPLEEPFLTADTGLDDPCLLSAEARLFQYMGDRRSSRMFRAFLVQEGLQASPELAALDAAIETQSRALGSATHSFWSPTLALQGNVNHIFSKEGAGADGGLDFSGIGMPGFPPERDDTDWSIALSLSFPLFEGGEKFATRKKAQEELFRLRVERKAAAERIEQRIRSALHKAGASHAGILQAQLSADAANKSLEVVEDAYSRGAVSILDLLDAQNAALVANLSAANTVYDFLIDLMAVERAVGAFEFFMTPEDIDNLRTRVESYFEEMEDSEFDD